MMSPIDVDDPTTWPPQLCEVVSKWAERCNGTTNYTNDLALPSEHEGPFRELFKGHLLRAYHYTRLLPHERMMVLNAGLRPLSAELVSCRIEAARAAGVISAAEAVELHKAHVFATGEQCNREGQVCLVLSKRVFEREPEACNPFLTTWGGEGIYRSSGAALLGERLKSLGSPTVVVALLELTGADSRHLVFPPIHKVFVAAALGLANVRVEIYYRAAVPPEHIECIREP